MRTRTERPANPNARRCAPMGVNVKCWKRLLSPTIFREDGFRFFVFSREEDRPHVHVHHADGEAKFWLEPRIELAQNYGLNDRQIRAAEALIRKHNDDIRAAWRKHFGR